MTDLVWSKKLRKQIHRLPPNARIEFLETIERECGCLYDRYTFRIRRFRKRCELHWPMCRSLEDWEIDD